MNKTVMLSTHIMQEVEAVCNRVIIINKGVLVADGSIEQLKAGQIGQKQTVLVEFDKMPELEVLRQIKGISKIEQINSTTYVAESESRMDIRPSIFQFAVNHQLVLLTLKEQQQSLENVFQELTRNF
jgi:ABC-2 type transport system ATP-binding protein